MANPQQGDLIRDVQTLFQVGAVGGMSDGELLDRFTARRAPAADLAFAAVVERHGPMVLRVCRSILGDEHDAQDAFQATFLILKNPEQKKVSFRAPSRLELQQVPKVAAKCDERYLAHGLLHQRSSRSEVFDASRHLLGVVNLPDEDQAIDDLTDAKRVLLAVSNAEMRRTSSVQS